MHAAALLTPDSQLYGFCYSAALAAGLSLLLVEGLRRRWPATAWIVLVAWAAVSGLVGARLAMAGLPAWSAALAQRALPAVEGRTFLGMVAAGSVALFFIQRLLGFRHTVSDAFAFVLPMGLAIVRIGCLVGGCCFGTPCNLPWAIGYGPGAHAFELHAGRGLILPTAVASLPVHPVQAYEFLLLLVVIAALLFARSRMQRPGSLFLLYVILQAWVRFLIEFVRSGPQPVVLLLRPVQLAMLAVVAVSVLALIIRERRRRPVPVPADSPTRSLAAASLLVVTVLLFRRWFSPAEQAAVAISCAAAGFALAVQFIRRAKGPGARWVPVSTLAAAVLMLGAGSDSVPPLEPPHVAYYNVEGAGGIGEYEGLCDYASYREAGLTVSRADQFRGAGRLEYGLGGHYYRSVWSDNALVDRHVAARAFVRFDHRLLGVEAGGIGIFGLPRGAGGDQFTLIPSGSIRFGYEDEGYAEVAIADNPAGLIPVLRYGFSVGSLRKWPLAVKFGISTSGFYLYPSIALTDGLVASPYAAIGPGHYRHIGLGVRYSFDRTLRPAWHRK